MAKSNDNQTGSAISLEQVNQNITFLIELVNNLHKRLDALAGVSATNQKPSKKNPMSQEEKDAIVKKFKAGAPYTSAQIKSIRRVDRVLVANAIGLIKGVGLKDAELNRLLFKKFGKKK